MKNIPNLSGIIGGLSLLVLVVFLFQGNTPLNHSNNTSDIAVSSLAIQTPMVGEIRMFGGNFAPRGWALCEGQLIKVAENPALFSVVGTMYGGDGRTTFALPDLRGRVPIHPNSANIRQGSKIGDEYIQYNTFKLDVKQQPSNAGIEFYINRGKIPSYQPSLGINFIIAVEGDFPARN